MPQWLLALHQRLAFGSKAAASGLIGTGSSLVFMSSPVYWVDTECIYAFRFKQSVTTLLAL